MIYNIYTVKDELNGYGALTLDVRDESAIRNFKNSIAGSADMQRFKNDFSLWCLGTYDTEKGITLTEERKLINGSSIETE